MLHTLKKKLVFTSGLPLLYTIMDIEKNEGLGKETVKMSSEEKNVSEFILKIGSPGFIVIIYYCVVPENIHTPTTEGIGNSGAVGGVKSPGKSREEGGERINYFPEGQLQFIPI